ncbi:MAG: glycosyltransferase [Nitrospirae bacterium]|nr:glycosyltransferase [Nitrospirota bacterium]
MPIKKILILDTGKEWGGGINSLIELLRRADREKYHFTALFYYNFNKGGDSDIKREIEKLGIEFILLRQKKQAGPVKLLKEIIKALFFFNKKLRKNLVFRIDYLCRIRENAGRIAGILKEMRADLLYLNNQPSSNLEGIIASRISGIPALQHSRIETTLNAFEIKAANEQLAKIICVSGGVRDSFIEQGVAPSKCTVVYNGIDISLSPRVSPGEVRRSCNISDDDILIGTVSSLIRRKRLNSLIKALSIASGKTDKAVKCMIVGEGPEKNNLLKLVKKKGMEDKIIFTGFQSDALSYINSMDIFAMTSEKEGFPRVLLEAMLMNKPAAAFDAAGVSELVVDGETGYLIPSGNISSFSKSLSKLIEDRDMRIRYGEKGRERIIDNFSIDRYINGVENVFDEIMRAGDNV